jgi:hypothetical protein
MGENLEIVWAEFSTLSQTVLLITPKNAKIRKLQTKSYKTFYDPNLRTFGMS